MKKIHKRCNINFSENQDKQITINNLFFPISSVSKNLVVLLGCYFIVS